MPRGRKIGTVRAPSNREVILREGKSCRVHDMTPGTATAFLQDKLNAAGDVDVCTKCIVRIRDHLAEKLRSK